MRRIRDQKSGEVSHMEQNTLAVANRATYRELGLATVAAMSLLPFGGLAAQESALSGTLSLGITSSQEPQMRQVVAAYEQLHPNVSVQLNILSGGSNELRRGLITRQMAQRMPDIVSTYDRFPRQFAEAGLTADMTQYLTRGGPISQDNFAEFFVGQYIVDGGEHSGEIHGLPVGADVVVLYYNKSDFDEAGLDYPDDTWTWDDVVEAARELTVTENGQTTRYGFGTRYHWHATYVPAIAAFGGQFLGDDGLVQLDTEAAVKAFRLYLDHVQEGIFATPAAIASIGDEASAFGNNLYSMLAGVRAHVPRIRAAMAEGMDFDVALPPINPETGDRASGMGSVGIALTPVGIENSEISYDFLDFFYNEEGGMGVLASTYAVTPPVDTLFDSPIWRDLPAPPGNNDVFVQAMDTGVPNPSGIPADSQGVIDTAIRNMVDQVLIAGMSVEEALIQAQETINAEIIRSRN